MKSRTLMYFAAITLFAALAIPVQLAAQGNKGKQKHHHYQLIDIGTFGGPNSSFVVPPPAGRLLNNSGASVGGADTHTPDPASCWNFDCSVARKPMMRTVPQQFATWPTATHSAEAVQERSSFAMD